MKINWDEIRTGVEFTIASTAIFFIPVMVFTGTHPCSDNNSTNNNIVELKKDSVDVLKKDTIFIKIYQVK